MSYCSSPRVLTLSMAGAATVDLMDERQGFRVAELNVGYPSVREDVSLNPGRHGTIDLTRLFGERAVTITGALVPSAAGSRQKMWHLLAPFLDPGARATLTYQVDEDVTVRSLTVRPALVTGPYKHPSVSQVQLGFKAATPFAYDATAKTASVSPLSDGGGRQYNLTYNRTYPGSGVQQVTLTNEGDFTAFPLLRFYGPITGAHGAFTVRIGSDPPLSAHVRFQPGYVIAGGHFVEVDTEARTAFLDGDTGQSVFSSLLIDPAEPWPFIPPGAPANYTQMILTGGGFTSATKLVATWQDPYLL